MTAFYKVFYKSLLSLFNRISLFLILMLISIMPAFGANCPNYSSVYKNLNQMDLTGNALIKITENNIAAIISNDFLMNQNDLSPLGIFDETYRINLMGRPALTMIKNVPKIEEKFNSNGLISLGSYLIVGKHNKAIVLKDGFDLTVEMKEHLKFCNIKLVLSSNGLGFNIWQETKHLSYIDLFLILNQPFNFNKLKDDLITVNSGTFEPGELSKRMSTLDSVVGQWPSTFYLPLHEYGVNLSSITIPRKAFRFSKDYDDFSDLFYLSQFNEIANPKLIKHDTVFEVIAKSYSNQNENHLALNSVVALNKRHSISYGVDVRSSGISLGQLSLKGRAFSNKGSLFYWSAGLREKNTLSINGNLLKYNWLQNIGTTTNLTIDYLNNKSTIIDFGIYAHKYSATTQSNLTAGIQLLNMNHKNNLNLQFLVNTIYSRETQFSLGAVIEPHTNQKKVYFEFKNKLLKGSHSKVNVKALLNSPKRYYVINDISHYWNVISSQLSEPMKNEWRNMFDVNK